jgi:transcriptional regulator with XRE-family HTH domain
MNMLATGAYLRTLRELQGISQGKLADQIGVATNTVWRIESGKQEPKTLQIINLLAVLAGRVADIAALINDPNATPEDGARLARNWFETAAHQASATELEAVATRLRQMADDIESGREVLPLADR